MNPTDNSPKVCNCPHHKVVPISIALIGIVMIVAAFIPTVITPMIQMVIFGALLVVIGGTKLMGRKCTCCTH